MCKLFKLLEEHIGRKIDEKLLKDIGRFRMSWVNRNEDHIEWLSSRYLGLVITRFSVTDFRVLFNEIMKIKDIDKLQEDIYHFKEVNKNFKVSSNVYNVVLFGLMAYYSQRKFSEHITNTAKTELFSIFAYKVISSKVGEWFGNYQLPLNVHKTVINKMSGHFKLKQFRNWQEVIDDYALILYINDKLRNGGDNHHKEAFNKCDVEGILYALTDGYNRLTSLMKEYTSVLREIEQNKGDVVSSSDITDSYEDGDKIGVVQNAYRQNFINLQQMVGDYSVLYNSQTLQLTKSIFPMTRFNLLQKNLRVISDNYLKEKIRYDGILKEIIEVNNNILIKRGIIPDLDNNVVDVLKNIKFIWTNSKIKDDNVKKIKSKMIKEVKHNLGIKSSSIINNISLFKVNDKVIR